MNGVELLSWLATATTIAVFLSGWRMCEQIRRQRSTQNVIYFPFIACSLCCVFWLKYGILLQDPAMICVNTVGLILQSVYLFIYYSFASDEQKKELDRFILASILFAYAVLGYIKYVVPSWSVALQHLGAVCAIFTAVMYGAPLSAVRKVVRMRSTETLPFGLCLTSLLASSEWCFYGYFIHDNIVMVSNGMGAIIAAVQLSLFCIYPSRMRYDLSPPTAPI